MTTREDRVMLMHPDRFLTSQLAGSPNPFETERETKLKEERIRMGIELMRGAGFRFVCACRLHLAYRCHITGPSFVTKSQGQEEYKD